VVDANFSRIGPMSGAELRELAGQLPVPDGSKALAPPVLGNLPKASMDAQTTHYAVGPAGYAVQAEYCRQSWSASIAARRP